jgi:hypothetical protein
VAITELSHLIQYRCVNREHLRLNEQDRVFVHTDGWAYCPGGRRAADHEFLPTGGLDRRRLERGVVQQRSG